MPSRPMSGLMYRSFVFNDYFFDLRHLGARTDLGQVVCAKHADRVDNQGEGDHQLDGGRKKLTRLERYTTDHDDRLLDTLTTQGGEEGRNNALREGGEKAGHNGPQVERRGQYNKILTV